MSENLNVHKVTLSSGKTVLLREMKIKHQELAAMAAAPRAGKDMHVLAILMQKEMLKQLVSHVNDQPLKGSQLEDLDSIFTYAEYQQLQTVIGELTGTGEKDLGKCQIELVSSGGI